jgi:hypothetical protein
MLNKYYQDEAPKHKFLKDMEKSQLSGSFISNDKTQPTLPSYDEDLNQS